MAGEGDGEEGVALIQAPDLSTKNVEEKKNTRLQLFYNIVCTMAGTGILQLPFTLKQGGWMMLAIMILVAFMARYTGGVLIRCLYAVKGGGRLRGYPDIGYAAYGRTGRIVVQVFHKATLVGVCTLFLILAGKFLAEGLRDWVGNESATHYLDTWTKHWIWVCTGVVLIIVVVFKTLQDLAILSLFGMFASLMVVVITVTVSLVDKHRYHLSPCPSSPVNESLIYHDTIDFSQFPAAFSAMTVSFGGHAVFPSIEQHAAVSTSFLTMLDASFLFIVLVLYIPTAVVGYYVYGNMTYSPILCNLPRCGPLRWVTIVSKLVIAFHVMTAYPILMNVVVREAEDAAGVDRAHPRRTRGTRAFMRLVIRSVIVVATGVVAYALPFFATFMTLVGALALGAIIYVLPVVFNFKLRGDKLGTAEKAWGCFVILVGVVGSGIGTYQAMVNLVAALKHPGNAWGE